MKSKYFHLIKFITKILKAESDAPLIECSFEPKDAIWKTKFDILYHMITSIELIVFVKDKQIVKND